MNNISTINSTVLQNSEFLGLMLKLLVFAESLTAAEMLPSITAFKANVNELSRHLTENIGESTAKTARNLNEHRISAYISLRHWIKGLANSLNTQNAIAGAKFWRAVEKIEDPRRSNQDAVTRAMKSLIENFRSFDATELSTHGVEPYIVAIEERQAAFIEAARNRGQEKDSRIERETAKLRTRCHRSFYALANHAFALATNAGDKECIEFVEQANGEIEARKCQLKTRKTLAKKAAEEKKVAEEKKAANSPLEGIHGPSNITTEAA